jgi:hypothetical protein
MLQYATVGSSESAAPELGQLNTARVRLGMPDGAWCPDARARAHARGCSGAMVHASARRSRSLTASLSVCQDSPREGSIEAVRGNEWALVRFRQVAAGQSPPSKYPTQRSTHFSIFIQEKKRHYGRSRRWSVFAAPLKLWKNRVLIPFYFYRAFAIDPRSCRLRFQHCANTTAHNSQWSL